MIYLNEESLQYAISMCRRRSRYKVGIALYSRRQIHELRDMIGRILQMPTHDDFMIRASEVLSESPYLDIRFENGSSIRVIPHSGAARGYRAHLLIADERMRSEDYLDTYRHVECLEEMEYQRERWVRRNPIFSETFSWNREGCRFEMDEEARLDREYEDVSEEALMKILSA